MDNKTSIFSFKKFWLPLFLFFVVVICFYKVVDRLPSVFSAIVSFIGVLSPFIVGIVIAFLLYKPANAIEKLIKKTKNEFWSKHARGFSVLICYIIALAILGIVLYLVLPRLFTSVVSLVNNLPEYYNSATDYLKNLAGDDGKILGFELSVITKEFSIAKILSYFDFSYVAKYLGEVFKATGAVVDFVLAVVISVYILLIREHLIRVCAKLISMVLPANKVKKLRRFLGKSCNVFYNYVYSQLIDAVIVSVLCLIVFTIARLPYALLLALLMGVSNLIPYFGALIGGVIVVFVTLVSTGNVVQALIALALVLGAQQLDANVLQPKIVADSVGLRPIYVLLAITVGGGLFGVIGILISVPVFAVIRMLILEYMNSLNGEDTPLVKKQEELSKNN